MNETLFQFYHWYISPENNLWQQAAAEAAHLASLGITQVWLPPAYKSAKGQYEPGYAVYDLYDLGEFDQKGSVRTKYGTKEEYLKAIEAFHDAKIKVLADIVLNHKMGADEKEQVTAQTVKADNRKEFLGEPHNTEAYTRFTFPGRQGKYSDFIWDQHCFTGFRQKGEIKMILNDVTNGTWDDVVGDENGNYDYLMGYDIAFRNESVREELKKWGCWYADTTKIDGFRLDGLKHITPNFYPEWIDTLKSCFKKDFPVVGEYWKSDLDVLLKYIEATEEKIALFDVPLHFNLHEASQKGKDYDIRKIFDNTLIQSKPHLSVTFVDNHDTQPLQALESTVEYWFKPIAYALILLRKDGLPCVFYPSLYGGHYSEEKDGENIEIDMPKLDVVQTMLKIRKDFAYGDQYEYFDDQNVVGWTRTGIQEKEYSGMAVLISNGDIGEKTMSLGENNKGRKMIDVLGNQQETITLNDKGEGLFKVGGGTVSIWVDELVKDKLKG